jgi:hypothetical protein
MESVVALIHVFLAATVGGEELSVSASISFHSGEMNPGTHWIGGWAGLRADLYDGKEWKSWPYRNSNSDPSSFGP